MFVTEFDFSSFEKKVTTDEDSNELKPYLLLELTTPIEQVKGSLRMQHPDKREVNVYVSAFDVTEVQVFFDVIAEFEKDFTFDEDKNGKLIGTGRYRGNLRLDVSRQGKVHLIKDSFAKRSNEYKNRPTINKIEEIIAAQLARQKKA